MIDSKDGTSYMRDTTEGRETGLPKATRLHEAGRSNEAGVGDGSNRFSGCPAGEAPFRSLPHLITPQDDLVMTPKLSIGNFGGRGY